MTRVRLRGYLLPCGWVAFIASCTAPRPPLVVTDPDPSVKIPAIEKAVREHDTSAIPQLITDLNNDDAAVRIYSIYALHSLTGESLGYQPYLDEEHRQAAVERWKQWLVAHPVKMAKGS